MSEDQKRRRSAGDRPLRLSGKGKMENEGQVLTSWQGPYLFLHLHPSVLSLGFVFVGQAVSK